MTTDLEEIGIDTARWSRAVDYAQKLCDEDALPAAAMCVGTSEIALPPVFLGRHNIAADSPPLREDAIFLIASITKPIVATAAMMLVERGELALGERVSEIIPEFAGSGRYGITLRHLLTHTSGLPDMLEDNQKLREDHSPLSVFVDRVCQVDPDFAAGTGVQYQSMGFAMLGEIIARVAGMSCAEFLHDEIFAPLGMTDSALGAPDEWFEPKSPPLAKGGPGGVGGKARADEATIDRIPEIRLPKHQSAESSWNWNQRYWRSLGAPWGGMLTTPADLARFARMMLNLGELDGERLLSPATVVSATRNQLHAMRDVPEVDRRCRPWGFGWRLNWPAHSANFGDLLGPGTYGHWGATGTVMWIDPDLDAFAVILTTQPQEPHGKLLAKLSNMIAAAFV